MSGAPYWIVKQRKSELLGLAEKVGLENYDHLLKVDLESALAEHIRANESRLSQNPSLDAFFKSIASMASPVKREINNALALTTRDDAKKPRGRRITKAREEIEAPSSDSDIQSPTSTALSMLPSLPIPASPSQLADRIESQTNSLRTQASSLVTDSGIPAYLSSIRANLSSPTSIQLLALAIEAWGLRFHVLPMRYLTTIPSSFTLGMGEIPVQLPDLFALLTAGFWGPVGTWILTSVVLPLMGAWFFNFTMTRGRARGYKYDPLSFNVAKGLVAWMVYEKGVRLGWVLSERYVGTVEDGVPGGYHGMITGAGIGGLMSVYEAVLRK